MISNKLSESLSGGGEPRNVASRARSISPLSADLIVWFVEVYGCQEGGAHNMRHFSS